MRALCLTLLATIFFSVPALALTSDWASSEYLQARFVSAVNGVKEAGDFKAALHVDLAEGWHTYWREPGDAGLPPRFEWSGSENIKSVTLHWPSAVEKDEHGFKVNAYTDEVAFPLDVVLETLGAPVALKLKTDIMVCKDICIPQTLELSLDMSADDHAQTELSGFIQHATEKVPASGDRTVFALDAEKSQAE